MMGKMCNICKKSNCHHWNAKVKCVDSFSRHFIKGNIYNVMYGQLESESGYSVYKYENIEEINNKHISKFEEIKEEK